VNLPREGRVGAGPRRVCGRRSRGAHQAGPVATEDEEAANTSPPRFVATASFVSRSEHRRLPRIRTSSLRFLFFRSKSSVLQVRPSSPMVSVLDAPLFDELISTRIDYSC
jgi:hypothetical protein